MDIYIKPKKKSEITGQNDITLGDVADVYAADGLKKRVENIKLKNSVNDGSYIISVLDMVAAIAAAMPGHTVVNLGEMDTLVVVKTKTPKKSNGFKWLKIAFVSLVLFVGSATAIMTFHTDSQLGTVFKQYHKIFVGHEVEKPFIINIPYSIGLALGIMVFFNHFGGRKMTKEPTPIQIEMEMYEKDAQDAMIQNLSRADENEKRSEESG